MGSGLEHVFVLMLENRSFDHMLGFSGISGRDAQDGTPTMIRGLSPLSLRATYEAYQQSSLSGIVRRRAQAWPPTRTRSVRSYLAANDYDGVTYGVVQGANFAMPVDPDHEFPDVVTQLAGAGSTYPAGGAYPGVVNDGFIASYVNSGMGAFPPEIMRCYSRDQLPVLNALANEFVVCDNWHASLPGPTWPNRFFAHAASSGGLDHSPTSGEIAKWSTVDGYGFPHGTIFDRLSARNIKWKLYEGDRVPIVGALKGINPITDISGYHDFAGDVSSGDYPYAYTFIEPAYGHWTSDFKCGTSQHPMDDVTRGEALIKATYEALRNSPLWSNSLLILTWDEHGGFFDHLPPPPAVAPGDTSPGVGFNQFGFTFQQYGPRVPAIVISPLIPRNLVDHRLYDHSSIPALIEGWLQLAPLTARDAGSNQLLSLLTLGTARTDALPGLPDPASSSVVGCDPVSFADVAISSAVVPQPVSRPDDSVDEGNLPGFLYVAMRSHVALTTPAEHPAIRARVAQIRTRREAAQYLSEVDAKVRAARAAAR